MPLAAGATVGPWELIGNYGPDPYYSTGSTTYTSGSFSVAADTLLVVGAAVGASAANCTVSTITNAGTALTWTRLIRRSAAAAADVANQELWYAHNTSAQTITYSLTWTENTDNYTGYGRGYLWMFTGHDTTTPFADSDSYSGTYIGGKPQSATAVTQVTGGVVVGVFTDNQDSGTLSSSNADSTGGIVNSSGTHNTAYFRRGISDSLAAGSFSPAMNTDEATYTFGGVFGVIQPYTAPTATKRGPGIGRY